MHFKSIGRKRRAAWSVAVGAVALVTALAGGAPTSFAQFPLDGRLIGTWLKEGTGERIEIERNGDILVTFIGDNEIFNSRGSIERCTDGGASVCLAGTMFRCAFRYTFVTDRRLHLDLRKGGEDPCGAMRGDYRRLSD